MITKLGDRQDVQEFCRGRITELLAQCSDKQREMFTRIFGGGAESVHKDKILSALNLCERTVRKNQKTGRLNTKGVGA